MKYIDEYRNKKLIDAVAKKIRGRVDAKRAFRIMEVCGTHTMNIFRFGLRDMLPENIELVSGPGCPVCVTPNDYIDTAIALAKLDNVIIATFGDMFRVPGSRSSLEKEKANGAHIKTVYSTIDALALAKRNPEKEIVFLGIGFETTSPTVASSILIAKKEGIANYSVLCGHKTMPEALHALAQDERLRIDGFLLPGHVSTIIGAKPYECLNKRYGTRCVIAGFEPLDIMQSILMLVAQRTPKVEIQYSRITSKAGNARAMKMIDAVFEEVDSMWRGIGNIKKSGLKIRRAYRHFDAGKKFVVEPGSIRENKGCMCGDVLKGIKTPSDCRLFGSSCTPMHPVGSCMVSSEGTCAAYYKYRVERK